MVPGWEVVASILCVGQCYLFLFLSLSFKPMILLFCIIMLVLSYYRYFSLHRNSTNSLHTCDISLNPRTGGTGHINPSKCRLVEQSLIIHVFVLPSALTPGRLSLADRVWASTSDNTLACQCNKWHLVSTPHTIHLAQLQLPNTGRSKQIHSHSFLFLVNTLSDIG